MPFCPCILSFIPVVTCCSVVKYCLALWDSVDCSTPGSSVLHYLPEFAQIPCPLSRIPSNHHILCHPLLLLLSVFTSIRVFSSEFPLCIRWPKYWSLSFNISPSSKYSGLISFKIDWFAFLAVQGTLKNFLQHHSSKVSTVWCLVFFIVPPSHPYMTTGKTRGLTMWTFVGKVPVGVFFHSYFVWHYIVICTTVYLSICL